MRLDTVKIVSPKDKSRFLVINVSDFVIGRHQLWDTHIEMKVQAALKAEAEAEAMAEAKKAEALAVEAAEIADQTDAKTANKPKKKG